jgi:hypothetical protein
MQSFLFKYTLLLNSVPCFGNCSSPTSRSVYPRLCFVHVCVSRKTVNNNSNKFIIVITVITSIILSLLLLLLLLCGLVVGVPDYRSRGPGSIHGVTTFSEN